uniref:Uncharacterized protein n=1 Tax=Arundo donax TaxID=35708 RepID=A0A0A9FCD1_ARUDO
MLSISELSITQDLKCVANINNECAVQIVHGEPLSVLHDLKALHIFHL